MPRALTDLMCSIYERWTIATPTDFFTLGIVIVAVGWLIARCGPDAAHA
jgi:hypothetical protein